MIEVKHRERENGAEEIFEEIMAMGLLNLIKTLTHILYKDNQTLGRRSTKKKPWLESDKIIYLKC